MVPDVSLSRPCSGGGSDAKNLPPRNSESKRRFGIEHSTLPRSDGAPVTLAVKSSRGRLHSTDDAANEHGRFRSAHRREFNAGTVPQLAVGSIVVFKAFGDRYAKAHPAS